MLNRRAHVRAKTAKRVHEAALEIGFHASGLIGQRLREELPEYRLGFLLLETGQTFYGEFARQLPWRSTKLPISAASSISITPARDRPKKSPQSCTELAARCMAVAVVAPEHPAVSAAVAALAERGIPVFSLLSDFAAGARHAYVGVHNGKVGRTAAWMIANSARGPARSRCSSAATASTVTRRARWVSAPISARRRRSFTVLDTIVNFEEPQIHA